eukprot:364800-Chlamydomonas_euryale.AAC.4
MRQCSRMLHVPPRGKYGTVERPNSAAPPGDELISAEPDRWCAGQPGATWQPCRTLGSNAAFKVDLTFCSSFLYFRPVPLPALSDAGCDPVTLAP